MPETPEDGALIEAMAQAIHDADDMAETVWPDGEDDNGYRGGDGWVRLCLNPETYRLAARQVVRLVRAHDASAQAAEITALRAELADARLQIAGGDMLIHAANLERDALAARLAVPGEDGALVCKLLAIADYWAAGDEDAETCSRAADALAALRARLAGLQQEPTPEAVERAAVRVKPLEWCKASLRGSRDWLQIRLAESVAGRYAIEKDDDELIRVTLSCEVVATDLADLNAAFSAAQSDFEARILSALTAPA